jgi:hypothetical protein
LATGGNCAGGLFAVRRISWILIRSCFVARFARRADDWYADRLGSFGFVPLVSGEGD